MRVLCIAALLTLAACEKKPEPGSCFKPQDNICLEYGPDQGAAGRRLCTGMKWTDGAGTCGADGRLGTCTQKDAKQLFYSGAPNNYSASSAKSACEHAGGTWN